MGSLRTFIKSVRSSKTIAAERATIRKESAHIRSSFRDPVMDNERRNKNIQKLVYLYILGEPTHFGQVECLKLLSSPRIYDKRIGYMAIMLIFDNNEDMLTLLTNSLDLDLKSADLFISSLALTALGNIASNELAKDLYPQVEKLMQATSPYIRKKAVLVAAKLIEMEPSLAEIFQRYLFQLLNEKDHGVLLSTLSLIETVFKITKSPELFKLVPKILAHLNFLLTVGYSPEYDVKGIPDPFLHVKLLKTLRTLMVDVSQENLEMLNDMLTHTCAKFQNNKATASYSILYECAKTIFTIQSDSSLRILGVNILSKFLGQKDNNFKYVALNTLLKVIEHEPLAVQRHRAIIVNCLYDQDVSIRRRSVELIFGIMNKQNVKLLTNEIMKYLENSGDDDIKDYITNQLTINLIKFSPSNTEDGKKFLITKLIELVKICGNFCNDEVLSIILAKISQSKQNQLVVNELSSLDKSLFTQYGLSLITVWCIGEYSSLVKLPLTIIGTILESLSAFNENEKIQIKLYLLNALIKISVHKPSIDLQNMIKSFKNDTDLQVQTRCIECLAIYDLPADVKIGLLEAIPPPPVKHYNDLNMMSNQEESAGLISMDDAEDKVMEKPKENNILMDLLGDDFGIGSSKQPDEAKKESNKIDILSDLFGNTNKNNTTSSVGHAAKAPESVEGFKDDSVRVGFVKASNANGKVQLDVIIESVSGPISDLGIFCAVPKSQKLSLTPLSKNSLAKAEWTQLRCDIEAAAGSKVKLRVKLQYNNGSAVNTQFDFALKDTLVL